jgi:nucleoside-diphosphate-sugar epimerase
VPQAFLNAALAGRPMTLHQRGEQRLDFTYVDDVAAGIELALFAPAAAGEIFNVTYGEARSVAELADTIRHYLPTARIEHRDEDVRRPRRGTLDIAKARRLLGYAPGIPLEEGIRRLLLAHGCPVPNEPAARAASLSAPL